MKIRRVEQSDAPAFLGLIKALADYEKLEPPDQSAGDRLVAELGSENPRFHAFVAEEEGKAAGYAIIFETYSSFAARPVLYLEDLFVLPEFRKQKIGFELFRYVVAEARRRGCARLEWVVLSWNTPAIRFYRNIGARRLDEWETYRLPGELFSKVLGD